MKHESPDQQFQAAKAAEFLRLTNTVPMPSHKPKRRGKDWLMGFAFSRSATGRK